MGKGSEWVSFMPLSRQIEMTAKCADIPETVPVLDRSSKGMGEGYNWCREEPPLTLWGGWPLDRG